MAIPFIAVELDKPRKLRLTMRGMIEFEQVTGKKITGLSDNENIETYAKLFWIMLKDEDKDLTFDEALDLIDGYPGGLNKMMEAITASVDTGAGKPPKSGKPKA
jgi:hypothetical protein